MTKLKKKVKIDQFADAVEAALKDYGNYVDFTVVRKAIHQTAEETAEEIAKLAPQRTGEYARSIVAGRPEQRHHVYKETVYADSPHYRLPHLLERPHALRGGGRSVPKPHWEKGSEGIADKLVKHIKEGLGNDS